MSYKDNVKKIEASLKHFYGVNSLVIPTTWEDTSWGNDAMYSYELNDLRIWIDCVDNSKSEMGYDLPKSEYQRFHVTTSDEYKDENPDDHYNDSMLLSTNNWSEIVEFVEQNNLREREMEEEFNLLESLEDLVDQLGRGKISDEQTLFVLKNIVEED